MSTQQQRSQNFFAASPSIRLSAFFIVITAGVVVAAVRCESGDYQSALTVAAIALGVGLLTYSSGSTQRILIGWFATAPLAAFYVRFPTNRSIITYDRIIIASLVLVLLSSWKSSARQETGRPLRFSISKFEVAWALLAVLALASTATRSGNVAYAARMTVDIFVLPLVVFHIARNYFDLQRAGKQLLVICIALALFLFVIGAYEFATGIDLFAFKGAEIVREGERRVNGPFATDSSFAVICLMLFVFLQAAPRMFHLRLDRCARLVYASALGAAVFGTLLPLFRAVAIALIVCWIFLSWSARASNSRSLTGVARDLVRSRSFFTGVVAAVILIALAGWFTTIAPSIAGSRLTDPRTAFGRLATWQAAVEITLDNPVFGAGLGNYPQYFDATHYYADEPAEEVLDTRAVDSPHSNALWISSELGLTGLAVYLAANVYLFMMGLRAFKNAGDRRQRTIASCFLALIFAYWIPGLTLSSGYYSDLNLCFFFLAGALSSRFVRSDGLRLRLPPSIVPDFGD